MSGALRLPGVTFRAETRTVDTGLPSLDVAGFVGFASSGPVNVPVPVEDVARFREIFGADVELAWDHERGQPVTGHLGATVEAFFQNGGRRCWVVRVSATQPRTNAYIVPGLARVAPRPAPGSSVPLVEAARLGARSPGSWSDDLTVNTSLTVRPVRVRSGGLSRDERGLSIELSVSDSHGLAAGDLLRFEHPGTGVSSFVAVGETGPAGRSELDDGVALDDAGPRVRVGVRGVVHARAIDSRQLAIRIGSMSIGVSATRVLGIEAEPQGEEPPECSVRVGRNRIEVLMPDSVAGGSPGRMVAFELPAGTLDLDPSFAEALPATAVMLIDSVITDAGAGADPAAKHAQRLVGTRLWIILGADDGTPSGVIPRARQATEQLRLADARGAAVAIDLWVRGTGGALRRMNGLSLAGGARSIDALPRDVDLFGHGLSGGRSGGDVRDLFLEASHPRFPLGRDSTEGMDVSFIVPLAVTAIPEAEYEQTAVGSHAAPSWERNGLSAFDPAAFVDSEMVGLDLSGYFGALGAGGAVPPAWSSGAQMAMQQLGNELTEMPRAGYHAPGGELAGVHALIDIEEVALIAVPDAVHSPWEPEVGTQFEVLPAPLLGPVRVETDPPRLRLSWSDVAGASRYELEWSDRPGFTEATAATTTSSTSTDLPPVNTCAAERYYRVRVRASDGGIGPWSNTSTLVYPADDFATEAETLDPPSALRLAAADAAVSSRVATVSWDHGPVSDGSRAQVELQLAEAPDMSGGRSMLLPAQEGSHERVVDRDPTRPLYVRARSRLGSGVSEWSGTTGIPPRARDGGVRPVVAPAGGRSWIPRVLAVHRALLDFCVARSDVIALLSVPAGVPRDDVRAYQDALTGRGDPSVRDRALSFGVLTSTWIVSRPDDGSEIRAVPPDGFVAGALADGALSVGAWASPGNRLARGALGLLAARTTRERLEAFGQQVNTLHATPRGFALTSAHTLTSNPDLTDVSVRRLMILIRKLALREGRLHVFEPNGPALLRHLQRRFEELLEGLFRRGALSGAEPAEAYRVVTDESVNSRQGLERGRAVVELRVAPARPLHFLDVRLIQSVGQGLQIEGSGV